MGFKKKDFYTDLRSLPENEIFGLSIMENK